MKRLLLSTVFAVGLAFPANSQTYSGQFPGNTVFGNTLGSTAAPVPSQVTNGQMANMLADTVKCNPTGLSAAVQDCASPIVTNLTANSNVTTGGTLTFAGGIANTSASTSLLSQLSSVSGTDSTHVAVAYNYLNVSSDTATLTGGGNGTFGALLYAILNFGNTTAMKGGRTAIQGVLTQQGTTGNNGPLQGFQPFYIAGGFSVEGKHNDNGTGITSTTASGSITGVNGIAVLDGTATDFYNIQGAEFDIAIATGASSFRKEGVLIAQLSNDAVHGASEGGLVIANQPGALGWNIGIEIGNTVGGALATTGSVLACGGNCGTITNGIDLSAFTISGLAYKSPGFSVAGNGVVLTGNGADQTLQFLASGASKGVRILTAATISTVQGVDQTGTGSFQPLAIAGSTLSLQTNGSTNALTINASQVINLPAVTTGTPAASLCLDGSGNIIKKTTAGSCI